jgi:glycosyltransferase involved in cell wall biosynthesis
MRPRILVISPAMCRGDIAAGDLRLERVLEQLVTFADVDFLTPEAEPEGPGGSRRYWDALRRLGVTIVSARFARRLTMWCRSQREPYDWIFVEFWHQAHSMAAELDAVRIESPRLRVAIDTVDVHFLRERAALERGAADYGSEAEIAAREQFEIASYRRADLLIACSREDTQALHAACPGVPTVIVPIVMPSRERVETPRGHTLLFVGGFRHTPNIDAVLWLVREILPLVREQVPDVVLHVAGSRVPPEIDALRGTPGVEIVGYVENTAEWIDRAAVSVAPLRYGAGMKGKVTEALAAAVPVVTTSIGVQGLNARSGEHVRIADTAADFAAAVVATLADPVAAERMGRQGQALVAGICGPDVIRRELMAAFTPAASAAEPGGPGWAGRIVARIGCGLWLLRGHAARLLRSAKARLDPWVT